MIIETAKEYWTIVRRYNQHRDNPAMAGVAKRELAKLETTSPAVIIRATKFKPHSVSPIGTGPEVA